MKIYIVSILLLLIKIVWSVPILKGDPTDVGLTTIEMVIKHGYSGETHFLTTSDGYNLQIHRIAKTGGVPVLIMHGMDSSSSSYVVYGPGVSLAYLLSDQNYDVWMLNARGNLYSRNHTTLDPDIDTEEFWNFSFHEIGTIDVAETIDYILEINGAPNLYYIGHSQGGATFYALMSTKPEYNQKIRMASLMAPAGYLHHTTDQSILIVVPFLDQIQELLNALGIYEAPGKAERRAWGQENCDKPEYLNDCMGFVSGHLDPEQVDPTMLAVVATNYPGGKSMKQDYHYGQVIRDKKFQLYDYGVDQNLILYGTETPPIYDFSKITAPVAIYYAMNDVIVNYQDIEIAISLLPNCVRSYIIPYEMFSHSDFTFAKDVRTLINDELLSFMAMH